MALTLQAGVMQNGGSLDGMEIWTGFRQQQNFYALLQQKVQFPGEMNMQAGDVTKPKWNNMGMRVFPDILDSDWFMINRPDLIKVTGNITRPTWASDIAGHSDAKSGMPWRQGFTSFVDAVVYPVSSAPAVATRWPPRPPSRRTRQTLGPPPSLPSAGGTGALPEP
jgi:hypothetical protein